MASNTPPFDLLATARVAMLKEGFAPEFPPAIQDELARLAVRSDAQASDLRHWLWSSIDNADTRDIDQVEFVEALSDGSLRLFVGIADVDAYASKGSLLDAHAGHNTISVYTGVKTFHMLPEQLSTNMTSLIEGQDRLALIIEMTVAPSGEFHSTRVYRAWIRNQARLDYKSVSHWIENESEPSFAVARAPQLVDQLRLQFEARDRLWRFRKAQGALTFSECEPLPVIRNGELQELTTPRTNCAREMIETLMIAANVAVAGVFRARRIPFLRRVVKSPKRWDRIREIAAGFGVMLPVEPEPSSLSEFLAERKEKDPAQFPELSLTILKLLGSGEYVVDAPDRAPPVHFGLAVNDYTHSTAPNRRYADLIVQRLLKEAAYTESALEQLALHCTERARAARKVERLVRKIAAAFLLKDRIGQVFAGLITGVKSKGVFVRLTDFPAEGRIMHGETGLDVGDKVKVRLIAVDLERGFIDFDALPNS